MLILYCCTVAKPLASSHLPNRKVLKHRGIPGSTHYTHEGNIASLSDTPWRSLGISTGQLALLLAGVFVVVNIGSATVVWWDKRCAARGQWRVREHSLLVWALIGGWPGGVWAMREFRHKTSEPSFLARHAIAALINMAAAAVIVYVAIV